MFRLLLIVRGVYIIPYFMLSYTGTFILILYPSGVISKSLCSLKDDSGNILSLKLDCALNQNPV